MLNKKIRFIILSLLIVALVVMSGCGKEPAQTKSPDSEEKTEQKTEEKYVLKAGHDQSTEHYYHRGLEKFKEIVESKTNGNITVELYPLSQLGSQRSVVEGVATGTVEMYLTNTMTLSSWVPEIGVFDLPYIFADRAQAYKILDGEIGTELVNKMEGSGIKVLAYFENGFRQMTSNKPLRTPADLVGVKIRVPESPVYIDTFTAMGAAPTPLAFNELFTALQTKIVDGQENPAGHAVVNRFYEVQDYINKTNHIYTAEPLIINLDLWNNMSDEYKQIIQDAAIEARDYERKLSSDEEAANFEALKEAGMEVIESDIAAFKESVKPVYEKYNDVHGETLKRIEEELAN